MPSATAPSSGDRPKCEVCNKTSGDNEQKLLQCARCKTANYCGPNYILKIDLAPSYFTEKGWDTISNPSISRTLSCPANATFAQLHKALQTAFGYSTTHIYDFEIKDLNAEPEDDSIESMMEQMMVISTPGAHKDRGPRQNLLRIVENDGPAMAFHAVDSIHGAQRKHSQTPEVLARKIKLSKVFDNKEYKNSRIEYTYDFGDSWWHFLKVYGRAPASGRFLCLDGEGHGVAEDVGSIPEWEKLKEAYRAQRTTQEQKENIQWFESMASNADPQGLGSGREHFWDKDEINRNLGDIF